MELISVFVKRTAVASNALSGKFAHLTIVDSNKSVVAVKVQVNCSQLLTFGVIDVKKKVKLLRTQKAHDLPNVFIFPEPRQNLKPFATLTSINANIKQ